MNPPTDIQSWLEDLGLGELAPVFEENHITPDVLHDLTLDDLREMGITSLGHRKKLLPALAALNTPESAIAPPIPAPPLPESQPSPKPRTVQQSKPVPASPRPIPIKAVVPVVAKTLAPAPEPDMPALEPLPVSTGRKSRRKGFSGAFLLVSVGIHLLLGIGAVYWVVQKIEAKRKLQFASAPPTANPSKRALEHKVSLQKKKNAGGSPAQARRIAVTGLASKITLPEMPNVPTTSTQFVAGRMAGMGGAGFGSGLGFGNGSGMGVGGMGGGGLGLTMFGARGGAGLTGYFYDLKQTKDRKPTELAPMAKDESKGGPYYEILKKFGENWDTRLLDNYYRSQPPLIATQIYVTNGDSNEAAKAFGEEKNCIGNGWIVHYKGSAIAPKDGTFRFVGLGDNVLIVRLNGKNIFDFASAVSPTANTSADLGPAGPEGWKLAGGAWFDVRRGDLLKLEVLIGDSGGLFSDYLFIEEKGVKYAERSDAPGSYAYPVFQLSPTPIPRDAGKNGNPQPARTQLVFPATGSANALDLLKR